MGRLLALSMLALAGFVMADRGAVTEAGLRVEVVTTDDIPTVNPNTGMRFRTWSLFLVCSPSWLEDSSTSRLEALFSQFKVFGEVIGSRNLAVWFAPVENDAGQVWGLDVERNVHFCEKYNLLPSEGPHILVTSHYPDSLDPAGNLWKLSLGGQSDDHIRHLLAKLADQILSNDLDQETIDSESYWRSWYGIIEQSLSATFQTLKPSSISFETKFFTIKLQY